jgi:hypothetical protein
VEKKKKLRVGSGGTRRKRVGWRKKLGPFSEVVMQQRQRKKGFPFYAFIFFYAFSFLVQFS